MRKNNILMAVTAFALLAGAAYAHAQGTGKTANNKVTVDIRNLKTNVADGNKKSDASNKPDTKADNNGLLAQNTDANTHGAADKGDRSGTNDGAAGTSATAVESSVAEGASGSAGSGDDAPSSAAPTFLNVGDDTCMGSSGLGVQSLDLGMSVSSTWRDENCIMLRNARELKNQGHDKAAKARLCMNEDNALAFELAGEPCPRALPSTQAALERIRAWNPGYRAVAAAPVQLAARDGGAGARQVAILPPAAGKGTDWVSTFVEAIKAFFGSAHDAGTTDTGAGPFQSPFDLPE